MSFEEQVNTVFSWLEKAPKEEQLLFKNTPKDKLIRYHHSLGMNIRNHLNLWANEWVPDIKNGVDYSPEHPDAISQRIIEAVWEKAQTEIME
jgi:hypothetical protein